PSLATKSHGPANCGGVVISVVGSATPHWRAWKKTLTGPPVPPVRLIVTVADVLPFVSDTMAPLTENDPPRSSSLIWTLAVVRGPSVVAGTGGGPSVVRRFVSCTPNR